jgi:hypothetical protein
MSAHTPEPARPACRACRFYVANKLDAELGELGICRRNPPQVIARTETLPADENRGRYQAEIDSCVSAEWPVVIASDWCGEYRWRHGSPDLAEFIRGQSSEPLKTGVAFTDAAAAGVILALDKLRDDARKIGRPDKPHGPIGADALDEAIAEANAKFPPANPQP